MSVDIKYFCNPDEIEANAKKQLEDYSQMEGLTELCAFPDIHFCDEKAIPVGVAFKTKDIFYPLVTGKDVGCGVTYATISKKYWLKPFDKNQHYKALERDHHKMTDEGLGGGNHFLSIEEDADNIYIICHTGSRNRGIELYQHGYFLKTEYSHTFSKKVEHVGYKWMLNNHHEYLSKYWDTIDYAADRRLEFVVRTLLWLQNANYLQCDKSLLPKNIMTYLIKGRVDPYNHPKVDMFGTVFDLHGSVHNHHTFAHDGIIHRKGSTEIKPGEQIAIPLSMTRGTLIVELPKYSDATNALNSCSHGAGRSLSRFDAMKHWRTVLKEKERKNYKDKFSELLDRSGEFPSGYLQEFDYAYKESDSILEHQPYLKKVTQTTPIVTIKFTEI